MFRYGHFEVGSYAPATLRRGHIVRLQVALNDAGEYRSVSLIPLPEGVPSYTRAILCDQVFVHSAGNRYLNPDGRWIGFEWLVWDDVEYTVQLDLDGVVKELVVPALPLPAEPGFSIEESIPFTQGALAGYIYQAQIVGSYTSGGVKIITPNTSEFVAVNVSQPHRLYRHTDGFWRLQLFDGSGVELANGTALNMPAVLVVWSHFR